jgi:hypothetical protein
MSNVSSKSYTTAPNLTQWPKMSRYISGPIFYFCPFLSHLGIFKYVLWNRPASVLGPFPPWNVARQCSIMGCTRACSRVEPASLPPPTFSPLSIHIPSEAGVGIAHPKPVPFEVWDNTL